MKKGFTLIELSIVLIIIGLLTGGILVAKSMISAARLDMQVRQLQQFEIAISNFKLNFGSTYELGDNPNIAPGGDGDGVIDDRFASPCVIYEQVYVWQQLQNTGMISTNLTNPCNVSSFNNYAGVVFPEFDETSLWTSLVHAASNKIPVIYQKNTFRFYQTNSLAESVLALDAKMDDGSSSSGYITSVEYSTSTFCDAYLRTGATINTLCDIVYTPDGPQPRIP